MKELYEVTRSKTETWWWVSVPYSLCFVVLALLYETNRVQVAFDVDVDRAVLANMAIRHCARVAEVASTSETVTVAIAKACR